MATRERIGLCLLLVVQAVMLSVISWQTGPGRDEWGHLPSGLYTLQYGDHRPYCVNPPLTRLIAAFPVVAGGGGIEYEPLPNMTGLRSEGFLGLAYIVQQGERVFTWMSIARMGVIPIALFGTYLIWMLGRRLYGASSGLAAAVLWVFSPTVLTFGASITPDVSAAVFGLLAIWRFYIWLQLGTWRHAVLFGVCLALAMLSKSTWIILPVVCVVFVFLGGWRRRRPWNLRRRATQFAASAVVTWIVIHACYDFRGVLQPLGSFSFTSSTLSGIPPTNSMSPETGNRFAGTWLAALPVPLPADYVYGIDIQRRDFDSGFVSYFLGEWRDHGWYHYYITAIFLKEPLALWLLATLAWGNYYWSGSRGNGSRFPRTAQWILFAPGVVVLLLVSGHTGFNHHLRYVLPFFPAMYLLIARPMNHVTSRVRMACWLCLVWYAASSASMLPRSYAFFTEAVGGAREGWRYLGDSNLDWGQDLLTAKQWCDQNPDKRPVYLVYSIDMIDFKELGLDAENGKPWMTRDGPTQPGWWIVFSRPLLEPGMRWFREHRPDIELSVTTSIYKVTEVPEKR